LKNGKKNRPEWVDRGKSIRQLIEELKSFENQELEVRISMDYGDSHQSISSVRKIDSCRLLISAVNFHDKKAKQLNRPELVDCKKSIRQLIEELNLFSSENQDLEVRISIDYENSHQPISLVGKDGLYCLLMSAVNFYDKKADYPDQDDF